MDRRLGSTKLRAGPRSGFLQQPARKKPTRSAVPPADGDAGGPRFTGDLDIPVRPTEENRHRVLGEPEGGNAGPHAVAFIREGFLRSKRAAGHPKDLADIEALLDPPA